MRPRGEHLLVRLLWPAVRRPRSTILIAAVIIALGAIGASRIRPAASITSMLAEDNPAGRAFREIVQRFSVMDELVLLVSAPTTESPQLARSQLQRFAQRLADHIAASETLTSMCERVSYRRLPEIRRFIEEQMVPHALFYLTETQLTELRQRLSPEAIREQIRRNEELIAAPGAVGHALSDTILRDPLRLHELFLPAIAPHHDAEDPAAVGDLMLSRDGRTLMIRLRGTRSARDLDFARHFTSEVRRAADTLNQDDLRLTLTGAYAIATTAERSIRTDMIRSITGSILALMLVFAVVYRHPLSFVIAAAPVAGGIVTAFGISSLYTTELTPVVAVIGAVLAGLAIDFCIHFLSHYTHQRATLEHAPAVADTLQCVGPALIAACVTSIVGFSAIAASGVPALRHFGGLGALGLACALVATLTMLPASLSLLAAKGVILGQARPLHGTFAALVGTASRRYKGIVATTTIVAALLLSAFVFGVDAPRFEQKLTVLHPQPNEALTAQHTLGERFGLDPDPLLIYLEADTAEHMVSLAHRVKQRLDEGWADNVGNVELSGTLGLASLLPEPDIIAARENPLAQFDADRIVADFRSAVAESIFDPAAYDGYIGFLRRLFTASHAPTIETLRAYTQVARLVLPEPGIDANQPPAALTLIRLRRPLTDRATRDHVIDAIRLRLADLHGATLTGTSVIAHDTERRIRGELARVMAIAALLVIGWLFLYFRNARAVALALIPATTGFACLLGIMTLADIRLNMVNLIGLPLLAGVGVDDGIFLVSLARREQMGDRATDRTARIAAAAHALTMTTATTVLTFGTLTFTSTPAIQSLGLLLTIGMVACLSGALFLLMPILVRTEACPR